MTLQNTVELLTERMNEARYGTGSRKHVDIINELLKDKKLKWAVIGGLAVGLWGARAIPTVDIDMIGDMKTVRRITKLIGHPDMTSPAYMWLRGTPDEINLIVASKEPFFKYMLKTAKIMPKMRVTSRVGTALGKLAALNSLYRIHGKKHKGQQDLSDMLNLIAKMTDKEHEEFIDAAKETMSAFPYAVKDAQEAIRHVKTGEKVQISIYELG